jgi:hypothetical protein
MKAAILNIRYPAQPNTALPKTALAKTTLATTVLPQDTTRDLLRLFGLDRPPTRQCLVCHWQRDANGKLIAAWEPEIDPAIARIRA